MKLIHGFRTLALAALLLGPSAHDMVGQHTADPRELMHWSPFWFMDLDQSADWSVQHALEERRLARWREQQFVERLNRVARLWAKMVGEYNEKGAMNIKAARELQKAFHDLETSEGWPRPATK
jgi:hypothetical protein